MKIARTLVAALVLVIAAAACDASPTAPVNENPLIGSGEGIG